jgi:ABC-type Mn2+/Zn2+ transport system ATPase subunit
VLSAHRFRLLRAGVPMCGEIELGVELGQIIRLSGDNASGKTTFLRAVCGHYFEWTGTLRVRTREISYMRQGGVDFGTLCLADLAPLVCGYSRSRWSHLVESLELHSIVQRVMALLSGGEVQRAKFALGLLRSSELLLLDEPLAGVDQASAALMLRALSEASPKRAILVVEHRGTDNLPVHGEVFFK